MKNKFTQIAKTVVVAGALFGFVAIAGAASTWTPPTGTPPSNNVDAPINVSASTQTKAGVLGVTGFANFGTSRLTGAVDIGSSVLSGVHALGVVGDSVFQGNVTVSGSSAPNLTVGNGYIQANGPSAKVLVNGIPVCLQNGTSCPPAPVPPTVPSFWSSTTANDIYNTNTRTVMLGTPTAIDGSLKLFVSGKTRLGAEIDYGSASVLSVAPGTVNFDAPYVAGGRMSINGSTGEVTIGGNLKVSGQNVCRQDGTNCPTLGGGGTPGMTKGIPVYRLNPHCAEGYTWTHNSNMEITTRPWCEQEVENYTGTYYQKATWWNDASVTSHYRGTESSTGAGDCISGSRVTSSGVTYYADCSFTPTPVGYLGT